MSSQILPTSLAAANGVSAQNKTFEPNANVLKRKMIIVGMIDPTINGVVANVPVQIISAKQAGALFGFGFQLHRLVEKAFDTNNNIETWVIPQDEAGGGVKADGSVTFSGPATGSGVANLYVGGELNASFDVTSGDTATQIVAGLFADFAANGPQNSPTLPTINGGNPEKLDLIVKNRGTYGNEYDISINLEATEKDAPGIGAVVIPMLNGLTNPNLQDALDGLGTEDNQNEKHFTMLVHGYGQEVTALDIISNYNGPGNTFVGNYSKLVSRPFVAVTGDTDPDEAALVALRALADTRKLDRTNFVVPAPGSQTHPSEIGALVAGVVEATANVRAEEGYIDKPIPGARFGDDSERWTNKYSNRDLAVKGGVSTTLVKGNQLTIQNLATFYRPDDVAEESNGFRSVRNIAIIQNVIETVRLRFELPKWKNTTIVDDVSNVTDPASKAKARDVDSVIDEFVDLAEDFASKAWVFSASFTIDKLREGGQVLIRGNGTGFDTKLPIILSGEGGIFDTTVEFDTSLAVFL